MRNLGEFRVLLDYLVLFIYLYIYLSSSLNQYTDFTVIFVIPTKHDTHDSIDLYVHIYMYIFIEKACSHVDLRLLSLIDAQKDVFHSSIIFHVIEWKLINFSA